MLRKRKDKDLEKRLETELSRLCHGPGRNDILLKGIRTPALTGKLWRRHVGRHRLIYFVPPEEKLIFPVFLSPRPRNGFNYENLEKIEAIAQQIIFDYEQQQFEKFKRWEYSG